MWNKRLSRTSTPCDGFGFFFALFNFFQEIVLLFASNRPKATHKRMKQSQGAGASGYLGWSLYFPFEEFSPEDMASRATLIDGFINYLSPITTPAQKVPSVYSRQRLILNIDFI